MRRGIMAASLEDALKRLDGAIGQLEAAVHRRLEVERRRGDLETELQIMQDDRARLAVELDSATARLNRTEAAARDVGERVQRAVDAIQDVLADADADHPAERP
jgi:chromosome segregation ATPase